MAEYEEHAPRLVTRSLRHLPLTHGFREYYLYNNMYVTPQLDDVVVHSLSIH